MAKVKRVLLTGASGTVGHAALQQLCETQPRHEVTVFDVETPHARRRLLPYKDRVHIVWGDIRNAADVKIACSNQDVIIHLAAIIPPLADAEPALAHAVNVDGTRNIVAALEAASQPPFLLFSSSVSVYGDRLDSPYLSVGDDLHPSFGDEYARTKIEAERIIQSSNLNWSIFRLSAIFGVGNHQMTSLMFHMPLATPIEFTTPADAARAFVHAIAAQNRLNKTFFNLGGGANCRIAYRDFLNRSFAATGMGALDFPEHSFAEHNFHCGYYADGDVLNDILDFRRDSVASYFEQLRAATPALQRQLTRLSRPLVKRWLIRQSEPLQAIRKRDLEAATRFFKQPRQLM